MPSHSAPAGRGIRGSIENILIIVLILVILFLVFVPSQSTRDAASQPR